MGALSAAAHDLGIRQRTVDNHRPAVMKRTGVASLPDLIRLVMAAADRPVFLPQIYLHFSFAAQAGRREASANGEVVITLTS